MSPKLLRPCSRKSCWRSRRPNIGGSPAIGPGAMTAMSGWRDIGNCPRRPIPRGSHRAGNRTAMPTGSTKGIGTKPTFCSQLLPFLGGAFLCRAASRGQGEPGGDPDSVIIPICWPERGGLYAPTLRPRSLSSRGIVPLPPPKTFGIHAPFSPVASCRRASPRRRIARG